ncbi:TPA: hypothetical protein ACH3X1_008834 [Trebouxia sp. C0004]
MTTDEYVMFATSVREAELDSMEKLGLKVPYLKKWAQEQASLNYAAKGSAAESDESATKRLRLESFEVQAAVGSTVAQKRRERHQMRCPKRNVKSEEKALELVNLQDPSATVKAFDEAFERLMQATASR